MKKVTTLLCVLCMTIGIASAQSIIEFTTQKPVDEELVMNLYSTSINDPFTIDWGDGTTTTHNISPTDMPYFQRVSGKIKGETITITGNIVSLIATEQSITRVTVKNQAKLEKLTLSDNLITEVLFEGDVAPLQLLELNNNLLANSTENNPTLGLEIFASTLANLNLSNNNLICLNIEQLVNLKELYVKNNPDFTSLFIAMPEESRMIEKIDLSNGQLSHFYPIYMPALTSLHLSDNVLMEDFVIDHYYPALKYLSINNNYIPAINVRECKMLEQFNCSGNMLSSLDVSQNIALTHLFCSQNGLSYLDISNNIQLTTLHCSDNDLEKVDISHNSKLQEINVSHNPITHINLTNVYSLRRFEAAATLCDYFYFNYVNPMGRFEYVDVRDNSNMTAQSINCMFKTLPIHYGKSYNATLLISGSNGETSDTSYPNSSDMGWLTDINGDGTAQFDKVSVSIDAVDTGEKIELEGNFGGINSEQSYTLTQYSTENGTFALVQWDTPYFQRFREVTTDAYIGVPLVVMPYPQSGYRFESVEINGEKVYNDWFVVDEACSIKVNFVPFEKYISFTTTEGIPLSFQLGGSLETNKIEIDWGNGSRQPYDIPQYKDYEIAGGRIEGTSMSSTVTIYGDVTYANFESEPYFVGWDNRITAIDLSQNRSLQYLDLYWNPITSIDLSGQGDLEVLGVSYTAIKELNLSGAANLMQLECYSDGYGFEEDGIALLSQIDLSHTPKLRYLDAKNNALESIDFRYTPDLAYVNVSNNDLTTLDVTGLPLLWYLYATDNAIEQIDLSQNVQLLQLALGQNKLTQLDLSANNSIQLLSIENNQIKHLDVSNMQGLYQLKIGGNGMGACDLNDIYYSLPLYPELTPEEQAAIAGYPLNVGQAGEESPNESYGADASIATSKGWSINIQGNGSGCETTYIDIVPSDNGSIKLYDAEKNEIVSGSITLRNSLITIESTPDAGYCYNSLMINDVERVDGNTFMIGAYARVQAIFNTDNGIEDSPSENVRVYGAENCINIVTAQGVDVAVVAMDGRVVEHMRVYDNASIDVAPGIYIVRVVDNGSAIVHTVAVR